MRARSREQMYRDPLGQKNGYERYNGSPQRTTTSPSPTHTWQGAGGGSGAKSYQQKPLHELTQNTRQQPQPHYNTATRVIEQTKTTLAQTAGVAAIKCADSIHDQIINSYRRQIQNSANLDSLYEALKLRIQEVQQRKNLLEDSIRYLSQDFEKQIQQQTRDQEVLQSELENFKR